VDGWAVALIVVGILVLVAVLLFVFLLVRRNVRTKTKASDPAIKIGGPLDIEGDLLCAALIFQSLRAGHLGTDGRYYVVDSARLIPPESPLLGQEQSI